MFEILVTWFIGAVIFVALLLYVIGSLVTAPFKGDKGKTLVVIAGIVAIFLIVKRLLDDRRNKNEKKS